MSIMLNGVLVPVVPGSQTGVVGNLHCDSPFPSTAVMSWTEWRAAVLYHESRLEEESFSWDDYDN